MFNIFSTKGRLKRKGFIIYFLGLSLFWVTISYLLMHWLPPSKGESYFISRLALDILGLLSATPFMLRRAHDVSLPGYVLIVFWLAIPLSFRNIIYFKQYLNIEIPDFNWVSTILTLALLFLTLILFFFKSYSKDNKWGKYVK